VEDAFVRNGTRVLASIRLICKRKKRAANETRGIAREQNRRQVRLSVLCGEGKLKQLTALALTRVKGEKRLARSEKRRLSGEIRSGGCEQEGKRERAGEREGYAGEIQSNERI